MTRTSLLRTTALLLTAAAPATALAQTPAAQPAPAQPPAAANSLPVRPLTEPTATTDDSLGPIDNIKDIGETARMAFKLADSNNDNLISQKEATDLGNLLVGGFFFRADANGDGTITAEEGRQARDALFQKRPWLRYVVQRASMPEKAPGQPAAPETANPQQVVQGVLNLLDSNNDRQLNANEVKQAVQNSVQGLFTIADSNHDNQLSPQEIERGALAVVRTGAQAAFQAADADKNGQISQDEFLKAMTEPMNAVFTVLDANRDGQLSDQELRSAEQVILTQLKNLSPADPSVQPTSYVPQPPPSNPR